VTGVVRSPQEAPTPNGWPAAAVVHEHQEALWRYLRVLGADDELAADLAQEAFLTLLRAPFEDRGHAALRTWLRATAKNLFLTHCRRTKRVTIALDPDAVDRAIARFERDDDGAEYRLALERCLESLPARQRQAVEENARGIALATLAQRHDLGVEAIRSVLRRCKETLRDRIHRRLRDERA
jgi:RNA polymerase sigma-70 factor (ECF subfamily)